MTDVQLATDNFLAGVGFSGRISLSTSSSYLMSMSVTTTFNLTPTLYKIIPTTCITKRSLLRQTGRLRDYALNLLVRSFVCYQNCEHDILKNEWTDFDSILLTKVKKARTQTNKAQWCQIAKSTATNYKIRISQDIKHQATSKIQINTRKWSFVRKSSESNETHGKLHQLQHCQKNQQC